MKRWIPYLLTALVLLPILNSLRAPTDPSGVNLTQWSALPVMEGGRIKPLDSVARSSLRIFRGKQTIPMGEDHLTASSWLLRVMMDRPAAANLETFRIDHPQLKELLKSPDENKHYFSYTELEAFLPVIQQQARLVNRNSKEWDAYERALVQLFNNLIQYQKLGQTLYPPAERNLDAAAYTTLLRLRSQGVEDLSDTDRRKLVAWQLGLRDLGETHLHLVPNLADDQIDWMTLGGALGNPNALDQAQSKWVETLGVLVNAYQSGDTASFQTQLDTLDSLLDEQSWRAPKNKAEFLYNQFQLFYQSIVLYTFVFLFGFLAFIFWEKPLHTTAWWLLLIAFALHTIGLTLRVYITGYAPVTNLYSSAVFVGWFAVLMSLLLEKYSKDGIGAVAAAMIGFGSLVVAHNLGDSGDTMERMRAVLNSNFWLSTHVITITMGYSATYLAGFLAWFYLGLGMLTKRLNPERALRLRRMVYGTICFALLFSFVGTVLGGIWADQSWGRFWGWDPKENGALMIVLWNGLILHALLCHWAGTRGLMLCAIGGNIVTTWSWFGTNMLGVGLHAYGFMESGFYWLMGFCLSQVILIALGWAIPQSRWRSSIPQTPPPPPSN